MDARAKKRLSLLILQRDERTVSGFFGGGRGPISIQLQAPPARVMRRVGRGTRDLPGGGFFNGVQDMPAPGKLTLRALAPLYVIPISDPLVHGNFDRHNLFPTFCSAT